MRLSREQKRFGECVAKLDALSPLAVLSRGFAIAMNDDGIVKSAESLKSGDEFTLRLSDGERECRVK